MHLVKQNVEAHGLSARADLNGQRGIVLSYVESKGRCAVKFEDIRDPVLIKPSNLHEVEQPDVSDEQPAATDVESALIEQIQALRLTCPELTVKQLHEKLQHQPDGVGLSLSEVKRAASKAAKAATQAQAAMTPTKQQQVNVVKKRQAPEFVPFDAGAIVNEAATGRMYDVVKSGAGGRVVCRTDSGQRVELRQEQLILVGDSEGMHPAGYDVIRTSPLVGRIETCDELQRLLSKTSAPPQLSALPWDSFVATQQRCGSDTIEGLATHPHLAWKIPPGCPPAEARICCFALDAVAHHLVVEWRRGEGWRVLQSYMKPPRPGHGYTALEWVSAVPCGGADSGAAHGKYGGGRVIDDATYAKLLRSIHQLRQLCDQVLYETLLPQVPFLSDLGPKPPDDASEAVRLAYYEKIAPAGEWACQKISAAETIGATILPSVDGQPVQVLQGSPQGGHMQLLLEIPAALAVEIDRAYMAITGEAFTAIHYLRLVNYVASDFSVYSFTEEELAAGMDPNVRSYHGWAVRCNMWS